MIVAAVIAGLTAVLAHPLPYRTGLILAALAGIAAGLISDKLRRQRPSL